MKEREEIERKARHAQIEAEIRLEKEIEQAERSRKEALAEKILQEQELMNARNRVYEL
jgi:hypothetical protein